MMLKCDPGTNEDQAPTQGYCLLNKHMEKPLEETLGYLYNNSHNILKLKLQKKGVSKIQRGQK